MPSGPYDVVLCPDQELSQRTLELSTGLSEAGTYFTLNQKTHNPHLSLYMLQLDEEGLSEALSLLSGIAAETQTVTAVARHYHYSHDYLDVEYVKSDALSNLQERIIQSLNSVRDGLREKDAERLATATGEERENILKYGYRSVGNQFAPHLTFTRFTDDQSGIISTLPSPDTFNGRYSSLGIFKMGEHGTCIEPVNSWQLQ